VFTWWFSAEWGGKKCDGKVETWRRTHKDNRKGRKIRTKEKEEEGEAENNARARTNNAKVETRSKENHDETKAKEKEEEREADKNARARKKDGEDEIKTKDNGDKMGTKEKEEEGEPEKNPRARKKNREEETMANMMEKEREVGNNAIWGRLCISNNHEAANCPWGPWHGSRGHFGADGTFFHLRYRYFWKKIWE